MIFIMEWFLILNDGRNQLGSLVFEIVVKIMVEESFDDFNCQIQYLTDD